MFHAPLAAAPLAAAAINVPLDAAYASSRLDIQQKYGAALFASAPAKIVAATPVAAPLAAPVVAPLVAAPAKLSAAVPIATPLAYTNLPLDAASASSRLDLQERYSSAIVPATFAATAVATPLAAAPSKLVASAPLATPVAARLATPVAARLAYTNLPLDAAYASSRLDLHQNFGSIIVPAASAAIPAKLVAPAAVGAPLAAPVSTPLAAAPAKLVASAPVAAPLVAPVSAPLAYNNLPLDAAYASNRLDIQQNYGAALVPTAFAAAPAKISAAIAAPLSAPVAPVAPLKYTAATPTLW